MSVLQGGGCVRSRKNSNGKSDLLANVLSASVGMKKSGKRGKQRWHSNVQKRLCGWKNKN
jgi:hypothetical protein